MNADAIKRHIDAAVEFAKTRYVSARGQLNQFEREIRPAIRDMVRWERLSKEDEKDVIAHLEEVRTRIQIEADSESAASRGGH